MLKTWCISVLLCSKLYATDSIWIEKYVSNKVDAALSPYSMSVCSSIKYYINNGTNDVPITSFKPGDKVLVLVNIPPIKTETNLLAMNVVGYINFFIPPVTPPVPNLKFLR